MLMYMYLLFIDGKHNEMQDVESSCTNEQLWDVQLFISSFTNVSDAFYWMGQSSTQEIRERMQRLLRQNKAKDYNTDVVGPACSVSLDSPKPAITIPENTRNLLVFDTETIGLSNPIVCQLAYIVIEDCKITTEYDSILRLPNGVYISSHAERIHNISNDDCRTQGVDTRLALEQFAACANHIAKSGGYIVAHNAKFDIKALKATCSKWGMDDIAIEDIHRALFCTMQHSRVHSPLVDCKGRKKAFRNDELYMHLHGAPPSWAKLHNALDDVHVTLFNFVSAQERGWWR